MVKRVVVILILAAILVGVLVYSQTRTGPLKVSGFVEADEIRIGSRVGGRVQKVTVQEGQRVKAGDLLIELEPFNLAELRSQAAAQMTEKSAEYQRLVKGYRSQEIDQAEARRQQLAAQLEKLRNGPRPQEIAAASARLDNAKALLQLAKLTLDRVKPTFESGAASPEEYDRADQEFKSSITQIDMRQQELDLLKAGTRAEEVQQAEAALHEAEAALALMKAGYREEEIAKAKASLEAATANLKSLDTQLEELKVRVPVDAVVQAVNLHPGDLVAPNAPMLSLLDLRVLWVRAYVPENRLQFEVGRDVQVQVDSFPGRIFPAKISYISSQAEFTPGNVQTPEERSKQVFRIKATLSEGLDVLRPGMMADVVLDTPSPARKP